MKTFSYNRSISKVIAVTSGKGGVGKTNIAINLAMMMAEMDNEVTLLDADLGLANIDVMLNLRPLRNLEHVIKGEADLKDIIVKGPNNIHIIPAASGVKMMSSLTPRQHMALVHAFDDLAQATDVMIIDTSAGISDSVVQFCTAANEVMIVVCNEPASITDAYAMIKVLHQDYQIKRFRIVVNMVSNEAEGQEVFQRLLKVSERYLDVNLHLIGTVLFDPDVSRAARSQKPVTSAFPGCPASRSFKKLAEAADKLPRREFATGRLEFFLGQKLQNEPDQLRRVGV